jgi:hypothetical protein
MGMLLAAAGGFASAGYAFASCRFVILSFTDTEGTFEDVVGGPDGGGDVNRSFRVAAGLFTWLNPQSAENFDEGTCDGYRATMLEVLSEPYFEAARIMSVIATLLSIMLLVWILLISTLSMRRREIWFMTFWFFVQTCMVGLTFLIFQSSLCNDVGTDTSCELDEGGLVAIASCILWFVCLLVSCIFVKPLGQDLVLIDGELRSEFGERQSERKRQAEIRQMQKDQKAHEKAMEKQRRQDEKEARLAEQDEEQSTPQKRREEEDIEATPNTRQTAGDDEGMEVYLSRTLDHIEDYVLGDIDDDRH